MISKYNFMIFLFCLNLMACAHTPIKIDDEKDKRETVILPSIETVKELPSFSKEKNEVEIADSFNNIEPTWVLGSLIYIPEREVRSIDNFLENGINPKYLLLSEVVFKDFIENSVAANIAWLDFLKSELKDNIRAEVTVIKNSSTTIHRDDLDYQRLEWFTSSLDKQERNKYGIIIGYIDFTLTASLFKEDVASGQISGYGAKIGGKWYSKFGNTSVNHRLIALWSPLPFVTEILKKSFSTYGSSGHFTSNLKTGGRGLTLDEMLKNSLADNSLFMEKLNFISIRNYSASGKR